MLAERWVFDAKGLPELPNRSGFRNLALECPCSEALSKNCEEE
jgi:hypothetical protein